MIHMTLRLFEVLMSEARLMEGLSSLSINSQDHTPLLTLPIHSSESKSFPVDVRNESIIVSGHVITL